MNKESLMVLKNILKRSIVIGATVALAIFSAISAYAYDPSNR